MGFNYAFLVQVLSMLLHVSVGLLALVGLIVNGVVLPTRATGWMVYFIVLLVVDLIELVCVAVYYTRLQGGNLMGAASVWSSMYKLNFLHWISDFLVGFLLLVYFSTDNLGGLILHWGYVTTVAVVAYWLLELTLAWDMIIRFVSDGGSGSGLKATAPTAHRSQYRQDAAYYDDD